MTIGAETVNVTQPGLAGSANRRFVRSSELAGLNGVVQSGTAQVALANVFLQWAEWQLKQDGTILDPAFITLLYREVLGRTPSVDELNWQLTTCCCSSWAIGVTAGRSSRRPTSSTNAR